MVLYKNIDRTSLLKQIGNKFPNGKGVEIGTFKGEFSREILNNWNGTLYMVDVWRPLGDEYIDASNHKNHINAYAETMNNIKGLENRGIMIRGASTVSVDIFANESLDFVYIDANHAYDFVKEDIELWYPKVKKGGYVCGHDYIQFDWYTDPNFLENKKDKHIWGGDVYHGIFGVNPAVDEFCAQYNYDLCLTTEHFATWYVQK
jgi:hypothetical protein